MPARARGSSGGPNSSPRPSNTPVSERQQLAIVMQMSSQDNPPAPPTPAEERKRNRQQRNERGETPLHVAAIRGDHELVQKLLIQGLDPDVPDFAGWTPLHEACSYGWLEVVEVLVGYGASVNAKGLDDDTPLHDACTAGNLHMVQYLIQQGADPFSKNTEGKMPADYAPPHISSYLLTLRENNAKGTSGARARDESGKKTHASSSGDGKRSMEVVADEGKEGPPPGKDDGKDEGPNQLSSGVVSSTQDEVGACKRQYDDADEDDDGAKRKRKKEEEKEPMAKPVARVVGRVMTGTKPPGPASKTGAVPLGKNAQGSSKGSSGSGSGKSSAQSGQKSGGKVSVLNSFQGKSSGGSKGSSTQSKNDRKSPVASPKPSQSSKDSEADAEETKVLESSAPKVPPLKIVIPGGAGGVSSRNSEQEGEGGSGNRGGGKGRGSASTLPYVIPCTSADAGHASDSSDGADDKRPEGSGKGAQRVLRSHRTNDEKEKDKERSPASASQLAAKTPPPAGSGQDSDHQTATVSSSSTSGRFDSGGSTVELHPRKRKLKASKESHSRDPPKGSIEQMEGAGAIPPHCNPYQTFMHIRKQIDERQKSMFPVKPKPPKDFSQYLVNRCTYTLASSVPEEPPVEFPPGLPTQMREHFVKQEKKRQEMRSLQLVEKEKLVVAVEQEILRVHGRAERAVAHQSLPYSVCTLLRDEETYNVPATPEQEEKRNAQRSRCNGRQINSWLQEVDDKWEKIKEGMLRRQHMEASTLHATQTMKWEWKLKEAGLVDCKSTPKIDPKHVPIIHVANFDLPA